jgi:hypothetical protein
MAESIDWAKAKEIAEKKFAELRAEDDSERHSSYAGEEALAFAAKECGINDDVEGFCYFPNDPNTNGLSYLNEGDTYSETLLFDSESNTFSIGSWGDVVEKRQAEGTMYNE